MMIQQQLDTFCDFETTRRTQTDRIECDANDDNVVYCLLCEREKKRKQEEATIIQLSRNHAVTNDGKYFNFGRLKISETAIF